MTKRLEEKKEPGYYNFSNYEGTKNKEIIVDENTRVYQYDYNASVYLKNDIALTAYSNGFDILYDPKELYSLFKDGDFKNSGDKKSFGKKKFRDYIINNIPPEERSKVIVSSKNKYIQKLLLTEEGIYSLIIASDHKDARFIKEELLHMIRFNRQSQDISFNELLLRHSYTGLFDTDIKVLDRVYLDDKLKERINKYIAKGILFIRDMYQFPVIKRNVMTNEKIYYYIDNLDEVKIHNKLDCYISAIKIFEALASVLNTSDKTIREKIQGDIYDHIIPMEEIDGNPYIHINDIDMYLNRLFNNKSDIINNVFNTIFGNSIETFFSYDKQIIDPLVGLFINSLNGYREINESYPIKLYLEYKGYIEECNMTDTEAKNKILENYKDEII